MLERNRSTPAIEAVEKCIRTNKICILHINTTSGYLLYTDYAIHTLTSLLFKMWFCSLLLCFTCLTFHLPLVYPTRPRQEDDEVGRLKKHLQQKLVSAMYKPTVRPSLQPTIHPTQSRKVPSPSNSFIAQHMLYFEVGTNATRLSNLLANSSSHSGGSFASQFYNLSVCLFSKDHPVDQSKYLSKIHLVRIPKASSSSMSAVARRAVGCSPPGPCCHYPGVPIGSCASKGLFKCQEDKKVIGCTDHFPTLRYLFDSRVPSISMMRNPFTRSLSGFFYPGIHHNSDCPKDIDACFVEYAQNPKWQNIAVKMLTGDHAYAPVKTCITNDTCVHSVQKAIENLRLFAFMGVAEMWELSLLVFHRKFPSLAPDLSEFRMATEENSITKGILQSSSLLVNFCL